MNGYAHASYAAAMTELGRPRLLPGSRGWLLERAIAGSPHVDARGCYPLFACEDWGALPDDLTGLADALVSVVLVADPFGSHAPALLRRAFPDMCAPYKEHLVVDLANPRPSEHHRRKIRKARAIVRTECVVTPHTCADAWSALYAGLITRHDIRGTAAFSPATLAAQLDVPGIELYRADTDDGIAGMLLWYVQGDVGYYHLAAYSSIGYETGASYALFDAAIEAFRGRLRWLNLGAAAGVQTVVDDGLTRFKRGWANGARTAYLCGRILQPDAYAKLVQARGVEPGGFFPLYRQGEPA
jgi:Acetyltransferase (GNAT) domain